MNLTKYLERKYEARQPLILIDGECCSLRILAQVEELVRTTRWSTWTTVFGKSLVNETLPNVYGPYNGSLGPKEWESYFDTADLVISLGPHYTDTNTYNFTTIRREEVTISVSMNAVQIGFEVFDDAPHGFLGKLLQILDKDRIPKVDGPSKTIAMNGLSKIDDKQPVAQATFYSFVNQMFRDGDLILTETGTAAHGGRQFRLPQRSRLFGPAIWLSIGYMLPAALGVAVAKKDLSSGDNVRAILFIGDGSLQMSAQEISTIIKEKLDVIIFIINNSGYTIERAIHGRHQAYNDNAPWRHTKALDFFGDENENCRRNNFCARAYGELGRVLHDEKNRGGKGLRVIGGFMEWEDVQGALFHLMQKQIAGEK